MGGKIASLWAEIGADTTKLQTGLKGAKGSLGTFKSSLGEVVQKTTGFSLAQVGAAGAVAGVINEARKAITEWSSYAEAMEKGSAAAGVAVDEYSRLIQAGDDLRVSQDQMAKAMEMATKNGFEVTTESLAALADEFVSIQSPTERAAKMNKIFGRGWADMVPLLKNGGKAIRDASGAIDDSLIVTQKAVEANREYMKAMDDLGDAWQGMQNQLAQGLIPSVTEFVEILTSPNANEAADFINEVFKGTFLESAVSKEARATAEEIRNLTGSTADAAPPIKDLSDRLLELQGSEIVVTDATNSASSAFAGWNTETYTAYRGLSDVAGAADALAEAQGRLQGAIEGMEAAADNFLSSTANDLKTALDQYLPESSAQSEEALGALDEVFGTTFLADSQKQQRIDEVMKKFGQTGDLETMKAELIKIRDEGLEAVKQGFEDDILAAQNLKEEILNIPKSVEVEIHLTATGDLWALELTPEWGGSKSTPDGGGAQQGLAGGGSFVIPPGYPNDSFPLAPGIMAQSGETVTVTPEGQSAGVVVNVTQYISTPVDARSMAYDIASRIRAGR